MEAWAYKVRPVLIIWQWQWWHSAKLFFSRSSGDKIIDGGSLLKQNNLLKQYLQILLPCCFEQFPLQALIVFWKLVFRKLFFKFFYVCLSLEKLVNGKYFPVKGKFSLVSRKIFSFYFERKTLSESCEKFRSAILFADYIKFGLQTFNYYIYFVLNICFSISSLRI